jgi:hypothetical protein
MKKRIPFDIEFLLESILDESPDKFTITPEDQKKLEKLGIIKKAGSTYWAEPDAYPFFIEPKDKILIYKHTGVHGNMEFMLRGAEKRLDSENTFSFSYEFSTMQGDPGFVPKRDRNSGCYFHGLKANNLEDIRQYLNKHADYFAELEIRGSGGKEGVEAHEIAGRMWVDKNTISFWNEKEKIMPYMKQVLSFMENFNMNVEKALYEFIDSRGFYTHYELTGNLPDTKEKLSAAEKQELLAQKHFKKDKAEFGHDYWKKHAKKAARGFDFPAKASAAMPAREGHIKLKDLIKESPDFIINIDGNQRLAKYMDGDAIAFFVYPKFSAINVGGTHSDIMEVLQHAHENIDYITDDHPEAKQEFYDMVARRGIEISDFEAMLDSVYSGPLADFIKGGVHNDDDPGAFRIKSGGIAGRIWNRKKFISFWNNKDEVIDKWNDIERLYNDFGDKLGNLDEYQVDWLDRDVRNGGPLTPASSISSSIGQKKDGNQLDFLDKLAGEEPISKEEILKIQKRLHTLKPQEKKEALKKLGATNTKAADIAEKLGMTVAEFNHIMNVNESNNAD